MRIKLIIVCMILVLTGCGRSISQDVNEENISEGINEENTVRQDEEESVCDETEVYINQIYLDNEDCIIDDELFWSNISITTLVTGETHDYYASMDLDGNIHSMVEVIPDYYFYGPISSEKIALKNKDDGIKIVDANGDLTATYCVGNEYIKCVQEDTTGITIWVQEDIETFEKNESILKALDENGNVKFEMSTERLKEAYGFRWCEFNEIKYIGGSTYEFNEGGTVNDFDNNIHETSDFWFNVDSGIVMRIKVGNTMIGHGATSDGTYTMYYGDRHIVIWNQEGEITFDGSAVAKTSIGDGLFYADIATGWYTDYCIMNYKGEVIFNLEGVRNEPYYHNGSAAISIISANGGGIPYTTFMDTSGNWLFEPVEGDFTNYIKSINMCRILQKDNYYCYLDKTGKKWCAYENVDFYAQKEGAYYYVYFENGKFYLVKFVEK